MLLSFSSFFDVEVHQAFYSNGSLKNKRFGSGALRVQWHLLKHFLNLKQTYAWNVLVENLIKSVGLVYNFFQPKIITNCHVHAGNLHFDSDIKFGFKWNTPLLSVHT